MDGALGLFLQGRCHAESIGEDTAVFDVSIGEYHLRCQAAGLPALLADYRRHARLYEEFDHPDEPWSSSCFVGVGGPGAWPSLVVVQRYAPAGDGFEPGVLVVPETQRLFLGAGDRILTYDLSGPERLSEESANGGFRYWSRHGSVVLMAAELELAARDLSGRKRWTRSVEPPWTFSVAGEIIALDVMGSMSTVDLRSGLDVARDEAAED